MDYSRQSIALTQARLNAIEGISLVVDGLWGPKTSEALDGRYPEAVWPIGLVADPLGDPDWCAYAASLGIPMASIGPVAPVSGVFLPEGIVVHHTAGPEGREHGNPESLKEGGDDVSGPLYAFLVSRDATVDAITNGRSHNAGNGDISVLRAMRSGVPAGEVAPEGDNTTGNTPFYGIVLDHSGSKSDPVPLDAVQVLARVARMFTDAWCWDPLVRVIGHKEWTRRKPDPIFDMDHFRELVAKDAVPTLPPTAAKDHFSCPHCGALLSVVAGG